MEKNNFKAYILYGINKKVTFGECIKNGMQILLELLEGLDEDIKEER